MAMVRYRVSRSRTHIETKKSRPSGPSIYSDLSVATLGLKDMSAEERRNSQYKRSCPENPESAVPATGNQIASQLGLAGPQSRAGQKIRNNSALMPEPAHMPSIEG